MKSKALEQDVTPEDSPIELADKMRHGEEPMSPERLFTRCDRYALARGEPMAGTFVHAMLHAGRYDGARLEECPRCGADITEPPTKEVKQDG